MASSTPADLPATVPIFPLAGVLLLPRAPLPLHIFEPRYRAMVRDALAGDNHIAMIQPSGEAGDDPANPPVFRTGCLGRIVGSNILEDGRYNIILQGVCRFAVRTELPLLDGYRRVEADYSAYGQDLNGSAVSGIDREALVASMKTFLARRNLQANWDDVLKASDEAVVNSLAVACPFGIQEKQALLETLDLAARAQLLQALCDMEAASVANDNSPRAMH